MSCGTADEWPVPILHDSTAQFDNEKQIASASTDLTQAIPHRLPLGFESQAPSPAQHLLKRKPTSRVESTCCRLDA